jgi:hypothetical protein
MPAIHPVTATSTTRSPPGRMMPMQTSSVVAPAAGWNRRASSMPASVSASAVGRAIMRARLTPATRAGGSPRSPNAASVASDATIAIACPARSVAGACSRWPGAAAAPRRLGASEGTTAGSPVTHAATDMAVTPPAASTQAIQAGRAAMAIGRPL